MKHCVRCLLPAAALGADLDSAGVCAPCREQHRIDRARQEQLRRQRQADLEAALDSCRGQGEYDVLLNLSGGKDSCYLLYRLVKDCGLKVLAFTTDMNVPEVAWGNIERTVKSLGVDHLTYTPREGFYREMFRYLLSHQEERGAVRTVCYVCAPLFEGYSLRVAVEKGIPLVLAGYSPGQPEPERMEYEFPPAMIREHDWTPPELRACGLFSEADLGLFWNPAKYPPGTRFPRYLAPFHAWEYSQAEVMARVVELGLVTSKKAANPVHSNCPVNWLLMYSDLQHLGYNPYAPEFAALIREGKASRRYWRVMMPVVNFLIRRRLLLGRNVTRSLEWLGMKPSELRVTRRAGEAYGASPGTRIPLPMEPAAGRTGSA